jgi:hypothetical protein
VVDGGALSPEELGMSARPFRLTAPVVGEDDLHHAVTGSLRVLCPTDAVVNTWELRNASSAVEGARRKRLGALPGWPDLGIFWDGKVALVELKRERGWSLSPAQKELHARLERAGHAVIVAHTVEDTLRALQDRGCPLRGWVWA